MASVTLRAGGMNVGSLEQGSVMIRLKVQLVGVSAPMIAGWVRQFGEYSEVAVIHGSISDVKCDAIVSPANSFGNMDGGLDGKLRDFIGEQIEQTVRTEIGKRFFGELPVGMATAVQIGAESFPYLICAPTMRYPGEVASSINAYLAMKALLNVAYTHPGIASVAIPGLCALSGGMPPGLVARQMRVAYERVVYGKYAYSHWREEKAFADYILGRVDSTPVDLEKRVGFGAGSDRTGSFSGTNVCKESMPNEND